MSVHISACWPFPWTETCTDLDISSSFDGLDCPRGGSNLSDKGLNLSGSWQQGHSATYSTPSPHGSFAPLAFQPSAMTNCANQRLNYYCDAGISRVKLTCLTTVLTQLTFPIGG
ncbi:unnamed protein product [Brassica rapa subsp. trilocularis]